MSAGREGASRASGSVYFYTLMGVVVVLWAVAGLTRLTAARRAHGYHARPDVAATPMRLSLESKLDSLTPALDSLGAALDTHDRTAGRWFRTARRLYKEDEFLVAYYAPTMTSVLNGPVEADDPDSPPQPLGRRAGFGVVEAALFGDSADGSDAAGAVRGMLRAVASFRGATKFLDVSDTASLDAARLELARVMTMGLTGVDAELSGDALGESGAALEGVARGIEQLQSTRADSADRARVAALIRAGATELSSAKSFDDFDRLRFIVERAEPAARAVLKLRQRIDLRPVAARRLWSPGSATPFDAGAFDAWALAPEYAPHGSSALATLGAKLFVDPHLSGPETRSCATCHQSGAAFTDGLTRARAFEGHETLRNTPTLLNAPLQPAMFADERAGFVEDQIRDVLSSPAEMASSPELAARRVAHDSSYAPLVRAAFGPWARIDERSIRVALAAYIRTLVALNSPFDRAIRGDSSAIGEDARRGFNLFMGKARCGTCHFAPLFGGTMPPDFTRSELEIIGVPSASVTPRARLDEDTGRERVDAQPLHRGAFRVPTVRNAGVTGPYMHNGVFRTLDEVVDFYDRGGGAGIGERLPTQTLSSRALHLSPRDRQDLVAFLNSLTDTVVHVAKP